MTSVPYAQQCAATSAETNIRTTAAASLLVVARRALHEYGTRRNVDIDPVLTLLAESVAAWADQYGLERGAVSEAADLIVAESFAANRAAIVWPMLDLDSFSTSGISANQPYDDSFTKS